MLYFVNIVSMRGIFTGNRFETTKSQIIYSYYLRQILNLLPKTVYLYLIV